MNLLETTHFENIFAQITYVANRKCTPNWKFTGSPIYDKHNIILVYDGEAMLTCNNNEFKVSKGDLIYFKPGDYRKGYTFSNNLMKCYTIDFLYTLPYLSGDTWQLHTVELPLPTIDKINDKFLFSHLLDLFSKFTKTWLYEKHNKVIQGRAIFSEIISLLLRKKFENNFNYDNIRKVEKVISYMNNNLTKKLFLDELSDIVDISPSYLENIFKNVTGKSPISYLIDIRISKSKTLLDDGYTVAEVSALVGFNDIFYFSKCFKQHVGVSPSKYKSLNS